MFKGEQKSSMYNSAGGNLYLFKGVQDRIIELNI
jgi:hypothetical protein